MQVKSLLLLALLPFFLYAESLELRDGAIRASFESLSISENEDMGLVGVSYLLQPNDYFYYGGSVYGAVTGKRGGFFVGGLNVGAKYELYKDFYVDAGLFAGGGGGGSAPQGGGLMLKSYLGGLYAFENYSLGLHYSYVTFPNGDIDSTQLSVVADVKFQTLYTDPDFDFSFLKNYYFANNQEYIVSTLQTYMPKQGSKKVDGEALEESMKLVGVEYGFHLSKNIITYIETAGAFGGESTGYMEVLGGFGYSKELFKDTNAQAKISLGAAGGGKVNSGGGMVSKAYLGLTYDLTKSITTGVSAGYYHALEGDFDAAIAKLQVGINTNFLTLSDKDRGSMFEQFDNQKFNLRLAHQTYLYDPSLSPRDNGLAIHLVGAKLDWYLSESLYVSGQGFGAYRGEAGGYATGLFGLGYVSSPLFHLSLVAELALGAAGGGSLQTGEGSILLPTVGLRYNIDKKLAFELLYGKIAAINGALKTDVIDFSLVYRFDKLVQR